MSIEENIGNEQVTDTTGSTENQAQAPKTYTQEEFDRHMAGMKSSLQKKYEKTYSELGDIEELRALKQQAESKRVEESMKKGEFEKVLQELAAKKDAEIQKRDSVIKEYKVNTPLLSAAAKYRAVAPEQVKSLLANSVRLNSDGEVEVVGDDGTVKYTDAGTPLGVEDFVRSWLDQNPHFVSPSPSTTNARSSISNPGPGKLDITKLDMKNPQDRALYKEYRKANGIA
jgi:hypothetical protein